MEIFTYKMEMWQFWDLAVFQLQTLCWDSVGFIWNKAWLCDDGKEHKEKQL